MPANFDQGYGIEDDEPYEKLDWRELIEKAHLDGPAKALAVTSVVKDFGIDAVTLVVDYTSLLTPGTKAALEKALSEALGRPFGVHFETHAIDHRQTLQGQDELAIEQAKDKAFEAMTHHEGIAELAKQLQSTLDRGTVTLIDA